MVRLLVAKDTSLKGMITDTFKLLTGTLLAIPWNFHRLWSNRGWEWSLICCSHSCNCMETPYCVVSFP